MANKVHPQRASALSCSASAPAPASSSSVAAGRLIPAACTTTSCSSKREVFTIWLKSLVLGGKGCTVFDSEGQVVYRVDNYNSQGRDRVFLMDSRGKIICSIYKRKFKPFSDWEGHRTFDMERERQVPWFQVHKTSWAIFKRPSICKVIVNSDRNTSYLFKIQSQDNHSAGGYKIMDRSGALIAEMKRKQSLHGITLGNDVQTLSVEPNTDPSLVMGLVVVRSLIDSRM